MSTASETERVAWEHASVAVSLSLRGDYDAAGDELRDAIVDRTLLASAQMLAALVVTLADAMAKMPGSKATRDEIWQAAAADVLGRVIDGG